jgi:predicted dienelactone hydrolase
MARKVGLTTLHYRDKSRVNWEGTSARPLSTDIWYPTSDDSVCPEVFLGPPEAPLFKVGCATRDAEIAPGIFPLVLLSHGTGGAALQLGWLATILAENGYIVAGVNHHGNNALEPYVAEGFLFFWERPQDVSEVLTQLLEDESWGTRIETQRIGAAGFSLGGSTVIMLAGGEIDFQAFRAVYQDPDRDLMRDIPPEFPDQEAFLTLFKQLLRDDTIRVSLYRDERIKCVIAIAPVLGEAFTPAGLASIDIPVRILVGEADELAPPTNNAMRFRDLIKTAELTIFRGQVGHYVFLGEATEIGKQVAPLFCIDPPGIKRSVLHERASDLALELFDRSFGRE